MKDTMTVKDLVEFAREFSLSQFVPSVNIGKFVVIRTVNAGVHAGILEEKRGGYALLKNAYRLWSWTQPEKNTGSLSAVATYGVGEGSKIANKLPSIELEGVIEVIPATDKAAKSITSGKWS